MTRPDTRMAATDAALKAASLAEEKRAAVLDAQRVLEEARRDGDSARIRSAEAQLRTANARFNEASQAATDAKAAMDDSFRESDLQRLKPPAKRMPAALLIAIAMVPIVNLIWAALEWRNGNRLDAAVFAAPAPFMFISAGTEGAPLAIAAYFASPIIAWLIVRRWRK